MSNEIIHRSEISELQVTTLILTDKSGSGPCVITAPTGAPYQILGDRRGWENHIADYTIPQNKSGYVWTNTGAGVPMTYILPTGALEGTTEHFVRTGPALSVSPSGAARIFVLESGYFKPYGQTVILASSGAAIALASDGNNNWYPHFKMGTVN